jgi:TPP-dependent pyruvate/acetoin dehydrogenase alpha subunit
MVGISYDDGPGPEELFRTMARIRAFEERIGGHFRSGDIHGFVHVSIGQEPVAAGACAALRAEDLITTTHRGHGHCLAKGADPERMFAELFGRASGQCAGKGGSMHIADPEIGILGANGIVGAGIPIAVGGALAAQVLDDGRVALAFFGEGAVHTGAFHEAITLAVAWQLPAIFLCENNGYAEFTAASSWRGPGVRERAASYGLPASTIEGGEPELVRVAVAAAAARGRDGEGPSFIEAKTVRIHGHFEGDAQDYRPEEERREQPLRDPLRTSAEEIGAARAAELRSAAEAEMEEAVAKALRAPYPPESAVLEHVYA